MIMFFFASYILSYFFLLFTIQSEYYPATFIVSQHSQLFLQKIFMHTLLSNSLCWQYTILAGKVYKILQAILASQY